MWSQIIDLILIAFLSNKADEGEVADATRDRNLAKLGKCLLLAPVVSECGKPGQKKWSGARQASVDGTSFESLLYV